MKNLGKVKKPPCHSLLFLYDVPFQVLPSCLDTVTRLLVDQIRLFFMRVIKLACHIFVPFNAGTSVDIVSQPTRFSCPTLSPTICSKDFHCRHEILKLSLAFRISWSLAIRVAKTIREEEFDKNERASVPVSLSVHFLPFLGDGLVQVPVRVDPPRGRTVRW